MNLNHLFSPLKFIFYRSILAEFFVSSSRWQLLVY